jgi:hypothetical protein
LLICAFWAGALSVCPGQAPANDNFTNAIQLQGNSVVFNVTLTNSSFETGEATNVCGSTFAIYWQGSAWWRWTATNSSVVVIDSINPIGSGALGAVAVETGTDIANLTKIACSEVDMFTNRYLTFSATAGNAYFIQVVGRSPFNLRLTATNSPLVLQPPQSQTARRASSALFTVIAAGVQPLKYQWLFGGQALPGETAPTMLFHRLTTNQAGAYSVIVSNTTGVTTSSVANLVVSPVDPRPQLAGFSPASATNFNCTLKGEPGRRYRIETTTNLTDWIFEYVPTVVTGTNGFAIFSMPRAGNAKFVRAVVELDSEQCLAQLQQLYFVQKLWAIENQKSFSESGYTEQDIIPYVKNLPFCPSGGSNLDDSYVIQIYDLRYPPLCKWVPAIHYLQNSYFP